MFAWAKNVGTWFEKENFGLLIFRVFFGTCLIVCGICSFLSLKLLHHLGKSAIAIGFPLTETFWGFFAAFLFIATGIFTLLGFYFRCSMAILALMGLIGSWKHLSLDCFCAPYPSSFLLLVIGLTFLFIGPGTFCMKK